MWRALFARSVQVARRYRGSASFATTASIGSIPYEPRRAAPSTFPASDLSLDDVLDVWMKREPWHSHELLTRSLYYSLRAAEYEGLSSAQLLRTPKFQAFWRHLQREVPSMDANSAVMCLYNCAQYGLEDPSCSSALIDVCLQKSGSIPFKAFGILLWSLNKLNLYHDSQPLVSKVVHHFHMGLLSGVRFKPQAFANVLRVLAATRTWPDHLNQPVMEYVIRYVSDFDFHSLSIVLWAVTTARVPLPGNFTEQTGDESGAGGTVASGFMQLAGDAVATLLKKKELAVISLAHCCWAFGSAALYHEAFFTALSERLCSEPRGSPSLTPRLLSMAAWACARAGYYDKDLLDTIAAVSLTRLHGFNNQDLGNLGYAYGYLNHPSIDLLSAISCMMSSSPQLAAEDQACVLVAMACLIHGIYPEALLEQLMAPERVDALLKKGPCPYLHLILQIHSLVKAERPDLRRCMLQPPHDDMISASVLAESMVHCPRVYSVFHHNLCKAVLQITGSSQHFSSEALTMFSGAIDVEVILSSDGSPLPIPAQWRGWRQPQELLAQVYPQLTKLPLWKAITAAYFGTSVPEPVTLASDWAEKIGGPEEAMARRVAVEADGPRHYAVNCTHRLGYTVLKHRLLRALGWDLIVIPYFEWHPLAGEQEHIDYLTQRLFKQ